MSENTKLVIWIIFIILDIWILIDNGYNTNDKIFKGGKKWSMSANHRKRSR